MSQYSRMTVSIFAIFLMLFHAQSVKFIKDPQDIVSQDGFLEFQCATQSDQPVKITWFDRKTNQEFKPSMNFHMRSNLEGKSTNSDLTIVQPMKGHIYEVYCQATDGHVTEKSKIAYGSEPFINPLAEEVEEKTKIVYTGESVTLNCHVTEANPRPQIEWFKDKKFFMKRSFESPDLTIDVIDYFHQGQYQCILKNEAGSIENKPINVVVKQIDLQANDYPYDLEVRVGEKARLNCNINYHLKKWRKLNGLMDSKRSQINDNHLIISNVQSTDRGVYICEDPTQRYSSRINLIVYSDPEFIITPENQKILSGSSALLQCRAKGYPQPSIYWSTPEKNLIFSDSPNRDKYEILPEGHLKIYNVNMKDQGEYECTATSSQNLRTTKAILEVLPASLEDGNIDDSLQRKSSIPPVIKLIPSNLTISEGKTAYFPCEVDYAGDNFRYKVSWTKRTLSAGDITVVISSDQRFHIMPNGTLFIKDVRFEDTGTYECFVEITDNMLLKSKYSALLSISDSENGPSGPPDVPNAPSGLSYQLESQKVILTWNQPKNAPPNDIAYRVEYFNENQLELGWQFAVENWKVNEIEVKNLESDNSYYFIIRPFSRSNKVYGWSSYAIGPIKPNPIAIDGHDLIKTIQSIQLKDIESSNIGQNKLRIKWRVDETFLPYIGGFNMKYRQVPLIRCISDIYYYKQSGSKNRHASEYCSIYNLKKEFKSNHNQNKDIKFIDFIGGKLSNLDKLSSHVESITQKVEASSKNPNFEIILNEMKPFSCQEFEIEPFSLASSSYGSIKGRESQSNTILVREVRPSKPPTSLNVFWTNSTSISIDWSHLNNEDWNGLPVAYAVYLTDKFSRNVKVIKTDPSKNKIILGSIKENGPFTINIAAENCIDSSIRSENVDFFRVPESEMKTKRWGFESPATSQNQMPKDPVLSDSLIRIIMIVAGVVLMLVTILLCTSFLCCFRKKLDRKDLLSNLYTNQPSYDVNMKVETNGNFHLEPLLNAQLQQSQHHRTPLPPSYTTGATSNSNPINCNSSQRQDFLMTQQNQKNCFDNYPINSSANFIQIPPQQQQPAYSTYNPMIACNHHTQGYHQVVEDYGAPYASTVVVPEPIDQSQMSQPYQNQYICHSSSSATGGEESLTKGYNNSKKTNSTRTPSTTSSNGILSQRQMQQKQSQNNARHIFEHMIPPPPSSPPPPCPANGHAQMSSSNMLDTANYQHQNSNYSDLI